jgi:hypothetical protein
MTIIGDGLSADNLFSGNSGNDRFVLEIANDLGAASVYPLTSLEIQGNAPGGDSANRDSLEINDNSGAARNLEFDYLDSLAGDLDINTTVSAMINSFVIS